MRASRTVVVGRLIAILLLSGAGFARAETDECIPISAVPATITAPGVYCLTHKLVTTVPSGNAITIVANNVVLDFRGHVLKGKLGGPRATSVGIFAANQQQITIQNGTIQGFRVGIELRHESDPFVITGHLIERMRLHSNSRAGVSVVGGANIIQDNLITETGGDRTSIDALIAAIRVFGPSNRVLNNDIDHVFNGFHDEDQLKAGILFAFYPDGIAVNNRIGRVTPAIWMFNATGVYRDNITYAPDCEACPQYFGGVDIGNNH